MIDAKDIKQITDIATTVARQVVKELPQKKTGDTPLEAFDLVNKQYVDDLSNVYGRVEDTAGQSITQSGALKTFNSKTYTKGITWDSTNNQYVVLTSGKYLVTSSIYWSSTSANYFFSTIIYKNGSEYSRGIFGSANAQSGKLTSIVADTLDLSVNDTVQIYGIVSGGGAEDCGITSTYFNIIKIG